MLNLAAVHAKPGSAPDFLNKLVDVFRLEQAFFGRKHTLSDKPGA